MDRGSHSEATTDGVETALMGVAAGAIGVWCLDRTDWFMWNHEDEAARARTTSVRPGGEAPAPALVSKIEQRTGANLSERQHDVAGKLTHYMIGIAPAAGYALLRDKLPVQGPARGLLYGLGMFLLQDEAFNTVSGLGARPREYPWQAHARGLIAHLVYGLATELALNAMENMGRRGSREAGNGAAAPAA